MSDFVSGSDDMHGVTFEWMTEGMSFGGDYSPEQWPEYVWAEDIDLMRRAGVNLVNLGVFSWGLVEVSDGVFDWGWLDRVLDLLHEAGIGVNLATPTAAPPMWLLLAHPEICTVDEYGVRTSPGARLAWSPSSALFRTYALRMVRKIAERYGQHPALRLWHVSNEIGNENARCYGDETAAAWRLWLAAKYEDIDGLNTAWGTAFWGHTYGTFDQVLPPRVTRAEHNPGLLLDFERFTSDALLGHYLAEREVLREITPSIPITTNFMVMKYLGVDDYDRWARDVDLVANDHYTIGADATRHAELSFSADRVRGMSRGNPWLLMEHSTSAVNWQTVNRAKVPGELARNSLAHVARGADGVMFFQWRASTAGSEQFHSAMVPHAGAESKIFREVEQLGKTLKALAPLVGSQVEKAQVAILFDHEAAVAMRSTQFGSRIVNYLDLPLAIHGELTSRGIATDVVHPNCPIGEYKLVIVPTLFLVSDATSEALTQFVESGGHVLVSYLSGIVDESSRVRAGGYPGAFRELLGVRVDEFFPLFDGETVTLGQGLVAEKWTEHVEATVAQVISRYEDGDLAGGPAITRRRIGSGSATYLSASVTTGLGQVLADVLELADVQPTVAIEPGLEAVRRVGGGKAFLFLINHTDSALMAQASGTDLLSGSIARGTLSVPAGAVVVLEEAR